MMTASALFTRNGVLLIVPQIISQAYERPLSRSAWETCLVTQNIATFVFVSELGLDLNQQGAKPRPVSHPRGGLTNFNEENYPIPQKTFSVFPFASSLDVRRRSAY